MDAAHAHTRFLRVASPLPELRHRNEVAVHEGARIAPYVQIKGLPFAVATHPSVGQGCISLPLRVRSVLSAPADHEVAVVDIPRPPEAVRCQLVLHDGAFAVADPELEDAIADELRGLPLEVGLRLRTRAPGDEGRFVDVSVAEVEPARALMARKTDVVVRRSEGAGEPQPITLRGRILDALVRSGSAEDKLARIKSLMAPSA
eukprot:tig00000492_g1552.t1